LTYIAAQAVVGVALSASFDPSALAALARYWPLVSGSVALILGLSVASGLVLARVARLDPATAVLGMIPGGAPGMVAMSDELGADTPLVAFMQYARLCLVAVSASLLARFVLEGTDGGPAAHTAAMVLAQAQSSGFISQCVQYGTTALLALLGAWAGLRFGLPAGALVGPVLLGVIAGAAGIEHGTWPPGVLPAANVVIGMWVGLRFDRAAIRHVRRLLLPVVGAMLALMAGCALVSWAWVVTIGLDPLSAYLATTPGGIDAVAIAALDSGAAMAVILPVQVLRLLVMVLAGPFLVRWLHGRSRTTNIHRQAQHEIEV
jgi:membrane AbrB-like protein